MLSEEGPRGGPGLQHGTVTEIKDSGEDSGFKFHAHQWPAAPPGASSPASVSSSAERAASVPLRGVELGRRDGEGSPGGSPPIVGAASALATGWAMLAPSCVPSFLGDNSPFVYTNKRTSKLSTPRRL